MTEAMSVVKNIFGNILSVYDEYMLKTTLESRFILKFHEKMTEASASVCLILATALLVV